MPDKATKHIPKKQLPIGSSKNGKLKVMDGTTGKIKWRSGKQGFVRDNDFDPISPREYQKQINQQR